MDTEIFDFEEDSWHNDLKRSIGKIKISLPALDNSERRYCERAAYSEPKAPAAAADYFRSFFTAPHQ